MSDSHCYLCRNQPPTFICFCTEVQVCQACISSHLLENPAIGHKPVPLNHHDLIQTLRLERKDVQSVPDTRHKAREAKCFLLRKEIDRLNTFHTDALLTLQTLRITLEHQISTTIEEIGLSVTSAKESIDKKLKEMLRDELEGASPAAEDWNSQEVMEELLEMVMEIREIDLKTIVKDRLKVNIRLRDVSGEKFRPTFLYKVFGGSNSVGVFDAKSERNVKTLAASIRFFHNSCTCETSDGEVIITGGSLTGRSRNEVYLLDPVENKVKELASMHIARRSHCSIFTGQHLYVFGGLLEEDRLSLCERYTLSSDTWEDIAPMRERRAYLSCCEYQGAIYIGGGSEHSSLERYDRKLNEFKLISVPSICIEENCCMLTVSDGILLFHGSFRGEATKYDPATQRFIRAGDMCVGNSWSNCSPVLLDRTVYLLRADSVFKYHLDTHESAYVLRMAKLVKKRLAIDD